jgi:hypothetical protein
LAFDLIARLKLKDELSAKMRRIANQTERLQSSIRRTKRATDSWRDANGKLRDSMGRFAKEGDRASNAARRFGSSLQNVGSSAKVVGGYLGGIRSHFLGLAAAIGGATAAKSLFDKTIGEAAKFEQSEVIIKAMFRDDKKAKQYMEEMQKLAIDSPLLNSQDIFANSKSFISFSQDIDVLKRMYKIAERLLAMDPMQGVEGAVFALKELFSGDYVSMLKRFEFGTKAEWKEIKDLPVEKQVEAIEKLLDKYRITEDMIKQMGDTTLGIWNQIKEKTEVIFRTMGQPALTKIREFLDKINKEMENGDQSGFIKFGQDMLLGITKGFIGATTAIKNLASSIINDPEFQKLKDIKAKITFVFDKLYNKFMEWLKGGGQDQINRVTSDIINVLGTSIETAAPRIAAVVMTVGASIGEALVKGAVSYVKNNFWSLIMNAVPSISAKSIVSKAFKYMYDNGGGGGGKKSKPTVNHRARFARSGATFSHASGITRVPYNGYQATLHKGERVLTPEEAKEYNRGGGRGINVTITGNTFNVRNDSDIKRIAYELAELIEREGALMA